MKRFLFVVSLVFFCAFPVNAQDISAQSAVVIDADSKTILYEKNAYEQLSMASTTKVMTSIIACDYISENGDLLVLITEEMVAVEGSAMGLKSGDKILLSDLIVGMLLPSGNDCANSVAFAVAGSLENFAVLMNEKASEIGMDNSSFVTPSGLDADGHYSTAFDMALLMAKSLEYPLIANTMSQESIKVTYFCNEYATDLSVTLENHNKLLTYYEYCTGGKTGYTQKSGRTLVSSATKDDCTLVAVTLNASDDWNDQIIMYDTSFAQLKELVIEESSISVPTAEGMNVNLKTEEISFFCFDTQTIETKIFLPKFIYYSSYKQGEIVGKIVYYIDGKESETKYILKE
ncbi:MAG: D-alanyl-D-alanine carboxypeptidase family protein [Clostridia bacterium]